MKRIVTITPSWLIKNKSDFLKGIKSLNKLGFQILNSKALIKLPSPRKKAEEINRAFKKPGAEIILAQRGGYSSLKTLPFINFKSIKKNHKMLAGFSDISTLLNTVYENTGIITYHSPMVINFANPSKFTVQSFLNAINGFPEKNLFHNAPVKVYTHGKTSGVLKGGNLVTLTSLIGTKWETDTEGAIIFFEDVDEELHRIDRYLTQWLLAGKFKNIKGVVLGDFRGVKSSDVFRILSEQMRVSFPVIHCPYIGHVKNKITLPVGAKVRLDTHKKTLLVESV
jgi:muramoyltetrapeptide carboxypeptidase